MNMQDVEATEVVQPGSRLSYRLLLSGGELELEDLRGTLPLEPDFKWVSVRESSPRISALDRAESFLLLGGLLGVLLAESLWGFLRTATLNAILIMSGC